MSEPKAPNGANHASPHAERIPLFSDPMTQLADAFAPPKSPLNKSTAKVASIVVRDLPLVSIATDWDVDAVRASLRANIIGNFDAPAQLADAILGDDRVQATMGSRVSGLLGREVIFEAANDSAAAKEVLDAWVPCWDGIGSYGAQGFMQAYSTIMGFSPAQLIWDTTGPVWRPFMVPWHARFTYYHWTIRKYVALSQDGQFAINPGDGKWVMHAPWGEYRSWIFGALRALAEPWLIRHFAFRDWARFSEVHGIPIKKASAPASADPEQRSQFVAALQQLPSETTILLAKGLEGMGSDYNLELLEATDTSWESFPGLIDRCDMSIVLAILFQNLTTEVKGGSFAATDAHMDIRQGGLERDDKAWQKTIRQQVARPFAFLNFGDPDLAPKTRYDVQSVDTHKSQAALAMNVGMLVNYLRMSGVKVRDPKILFQSFGLEWDGVEFDQVDPTQVESKVAAAEVKPPSEPGSEADK
jgi:phage gp29-like protein